jgi:predicted RNA methylase
VNYYATFIPGLGELIAELVRERIPGAVIHRLLDGAILFETSLGYDKLNFFCFNNIFAVIDLMEHDDPEVALETHIAGYVKNAAPDDSAVRDIIAHNNRKFRSFRIVISRENKPVATDENLRVQAERHIARLSGLTVNRAKPDAEFWFLYRNEGFSLFMKRLTLRPSWEKSLHPGELPPPLAWMLCRLARLKHDDVVLDPFCGYGSIPNAAVRYFHITQCIAADNNEQAAAYTAARFRDRPGGITLHKTDFRSLVSILPPKSVDAVITDPPWGCYHDGEEFQEVLYAEMFGVFDTLLKDGGRVVVLGARTDELPRAAGNRFTLQQNIPILLSGKKAAIYCFDNKGEEK